MNKDIEVIWGIADDENLDEDVKITILATGFGISNIPGMEKGLAGSHTPVKNDDSKGEARPQAAEMPAAAGAGNLLDDSEHYDMVSFPEDQVRPRADVGIRVSGDSMEPEIPNGCTVFVRPTPAVEPGGVGIFVLDAQAYCKKLIADRQARKAKLRSLNPKYPDIVVEDETRMRTLGRVLGHYPQ